MCGIYGMVSLSGNHLRSPELAPSMAGTLRHRGPDGQGQWDAPDAILGAMRLRIIDRRPGTDQPYTSPSQKILVCNGEIYNGCEIRSRFPDHPYLSRTDVEPILPLIERYGTSGLSALDGMFAIAVWDTSSKRLYLARDRAGEKPLFYSRHRDEIWFASEIQTLLIHPEASRRIDQDALIDYLALSHVREPRTLFSSIQKVPAGQVIEFCAAGTREHAIDSPAGALTQTRRPPSPPVGESLLALIDRSVRNQLRSDVPVGVFLSGGMDSSLVTALAARHQPGLHTFTIRFPQHSYDESIYARRVAAEYHAYHHEVYATFDRLGYALDRLTSECAEPIADPAVVPTLLLAERAKEDVGVVLSGEGADELFGGYPTYLGHRWAKLTAWIPERFDPALRAVLSSPAASRARVPLAMLFDRFLKYRRTEYRARHLSWFGTGLFPYLSGTAQGVLLESLAEHRDPVEWAIRTDYRIYLREGMLTKLDRATMLSGLEARAPFLDRGVTSWAWATPSRDKVGLFGTKMSLRAAAAPVLPSWVLRRRKRGLSVPTAEWLNGTLRSAADRLLRPDYIAKQGLLPDLPFTRLLREHQEGRANHARALWPIVILQRWLEHWEGKSHDQRRGARSDARVHHV